MEDQIKELIAKGIKLDYKEIYEDTAVILRQGSDECYIENKVSYRVEHDQDKLLSLYRAKNKPLYSFLSVKLIPPTKEEIYEIRNITEDLIKACIEEYCKND